VADKKSKKKWVLRGVVWKAGKQVKCEERTVEIHSEGDLDKQEAKLRSDLSDFVLSQLKDMKDVKIEVESEIE
jgi:hypothetical protein